MIKRFHVLLHNTGWAKIDHTSASEAIAYFTKLGIRVRGVKEITDSYCAGV